MSDKPDLEVIDGGLADEPADEPETSEPTPEPTQQGVTIADIAEAHVLFVSRMKRQYKLAEGNIVRLLELAFNAHFTNLQIRQQPVFPPLAAPTPPEEVTDADGSEA